MDLKIVLRRNSKEQNPQVLFSNDVKNSWDKWKLK